MELIRGVRPMTGQDIEQVADLEQVCFSESWSENLIRMGLDSRLDTYFVYADHGAILGYAVVRILADEGEIQRIGVYPNYRRQGIDVYKRQEQERSEYGIKQMIRAVL